MLNGIRRWVSTHFEEQLHGGGFRPIQFVLYLKNLDDLHRSQVCLGVFISIAQLYMVVVFFPWICSLANHFSPVISDEAMVHCFIITRGHQDSTVCWYNSERDCRSSTVVYVQLYSDKTVTSLGAFCVQFYPLHWNLMNFSEEARRHMISHGLSILAFLSAGQLHEEDDDQYEDIVTWYVRRNMRESL